MALKIRYETIYRWSWKHIRMCPVGLKLCVVVESTLGRRRNVESIFIKYGSSFVCPEGWFIRVPCPLKCRWKSRRRITVDSMLIHHFCARKADSMNLYKEFCMCLFKSWKFYNSENAYYTLTCFWVLNTIWLLSILYVLHIFSFTFKFIYVNLFICYCTLSRWPILLEYMLIYQNKISWTL